MKHPCVPPAVLRWRGQQIETTHRASAVLFSPSTGSLDLLPESAAYPIWLRSSAKPFQAINVLTHPNLKDLTASQLAIAVASHGGMPMHLTEVSALLDKAGVGPEALQCGSHLPVDPDAMRTLLREGGHECALHHNCSGKHAAMLLACTWYGWDHATYRDPNHPLQQGILKALGQAVPPEAIGVGIDGCGVPVFSMSMGDGAALYAHLVSTQVYTPVVQAMATYPHLVGDPNRVDTLLMEASCGDLIAKVGAEGLIGVGHRPSGTGLMVKIHDGHLGARDRLCLALIEKLEWLNPQTVANLWHHSTFNTTVLNGRGDETGRYTFCL